LTLLRFRATLVVMPKRTRQPEKLDVFQNARRVFLEAVETTDITIVQKVMREMGAKGGKIGGKRRLETMTDAQRTKSARKAAKARWAKAKKTA
jgi:hypothetical protein